MGLPGIKSIAGRYQELGTKPIIIHWKIITSTLVMFLLWLGPTIHYRISVGSVSFSAMEPFTLLVIGGLILLYLSNTKQKTIRINVGIVLLLLLLGWTIIVRLWLPDWEHGLSDIRDWFEPILACSLLYITIKHGWRIYAKLVVPIAFMQALVGIYQHITDGFRPFASVESQYKLEYGGDVVARSAVGFFEHPNNFAIFLMIAILITIAWILEKKFRPSKVFLIVVLATLLPAIYWSYSKTQMVTILVALCLFTVLPFFKSRQLYLPMVVLLVAGILMGGWVAMNLWPEKFFTLSWRVDLWESALLTFKENPMILLFGNGDSAFALNAFWPQPHNLYFDALIKYGVIGVLLQIGVFIFIIQNSAKHFEGGLFRRDYLVRALWVGLIGFMVTGIVESALIGIETRMIFMLLFTCFMGLTREINLTTVQND